MLRPTGSILGRLTGSNGAPVAYASVTAIAPGADFGYGDTDQNGNYRIPALFPGDYKIEFQLMGGFRQFAHQKRTLDAADTFTVVADQDTVVDDVLLPTGSIAGRFLDRSGSPLPDVSVEVSGAGSTSWATTDSTGAYRVDDLATGDDYRVAFSDQNRTWRQYATGRTGPQDADRSPVTDGGTTVVDDQLLPAGGLVVTSRDSVTGLPVSDYCLYLEGAGSRNLCTDNGGLSFTDLAPGTYSGSAETAGDYLPQSVQVTVRSGETGSWRSSSYAAARSPPRSPTPRPAPRSRTPASRWRRPAPACSAPTANTAPTRPARSPPRGWRRVTTTSSSRRRTAAASARSGSAPPAAPATRSPPAGSPSPAARRRPSPRRSTRPARSPVWSAALPAAA
ncbi:carboxypeptidase regulatory-like domain-containing protein [Polymorphospora sp. NPDC051019]|uniref:MSCRAMM family protein n=1 Tax=Polymorphospora sp. NPDC051019 TaxID=3155725 RepID=UPI0034255F58